jgi:peptidoglycan hydrolase-like protein with peptidoglycan-binding domain
MVTHGPAVQRPAERTVEQSPLNASHISGRETYLDQAQTRAQTEILKRGSSGVAVFELQEQINHHRIANGLPRINVDGDFGPKTEAAVKTIQESLNKELKLDPPLAVDGKWGPRSNEALRVWGQRQVDAVKEAALPKPAATPSFVQEGYHKGKPYSFNASEILDVGGTRFVLCTSAAQAFEKMRAAAAQDGITLKINSAFRTNEQQAKLRADFEAGIGNPANQPGFSDHQSGFAVDIRLREDARVLTWLDKNGEKFGFDRPKRGQMENERKVSNEPWHWEYVPERERLQREFKEK